MVNYDIIKNPELRLLVKGSESINSQPEADVAAMVRRIADMPEAGQKQLIATLGDEQKQIQAAKLARGITPEIEQKKLEEGNTKMTVVLKKLDADVRTEHEKMDRSASESAADALIKQLDPPVTTDIKTKA